MAANTALSEAAPKPDHVPESLVYDFDMFKDPAYIADPHNRIIDIIKTAPPIFWTLIELTGGYTVPLTAVAALNALVALVLLAAPARERAF